MKRIFAITIIVLAGVLTGFKKDMNPVYVTGKLVREPNDKKARVFEIIVKGDENILAKTTTKVNGEFELSFTPSNEKYFDFFFIDPNHQTDTFFLKSYTQFKSDVLKISLYTFNRHVDDDNHVVCPKCGRSDDVIAESAHRVYYYCSRDKIKF